MVRKQLKRGSSPDRDKNRDASRWRVASIILCIRTSKQITDNISTETSRAVGVMKRTQHLTADKMILTGVHIIDLSTATVQDDAITAHAK